MLATAPAVPALVVEGEGKADAAAKLFPDHAVVAPMNGAKSPRKTDWSALAGRVVIIWPDNDKPGVDFAAVVAQLALSAGAISVKVIEVPADFPESWDLADDLPLGWEVGHLRQLLDGTTDTASNSADFAHSADGSSWPPLVPLDTPDLPRLSADCLPGWAGDFAAALSEATETPPELAVAMVLAACSTAGARRLQVMVKPGYFEPVNLWLACALPPGNRKSAVQGAAAAPLLAWERTVAEAMVDEIKQVTSKVKTAEARVKELRSKSARADDEGAARELARQAAEIERDIPEIPRQPQLWTSDATPERLGTILADNEERMSWLSSEGGVFDILAGRYSGGIPNLDLVLKAHSGDPDRVDRGSRPPVFLRHPLLTVGLSPQPEVLRGLASKPGFRGRGLLGRFLFLLPPSPLGYRTLNTRPIPAGIEAAYAAGLRAMLDMPLAVGDDGEKRPHLLRLTRDAVAEHQAFALHIETTMRPGSDFEAATDWAGKCPGAAARVAGVLHGIEHAHCAPWEHEISAATMNRALEIMAVVARHSLAAFDLMGADETIAAARRVWEWIKQGRRRSFTAREAFNALRGSFPRMADINTAMEVLVERGYLEITEPERTGTRGRPTSPTVTVRPDLAGGW